MIVLTDADANAYNDVDVVNDNASDGIVSTDTDASTDVVSETISLLILLTL